MFRVYLTNLAAYNSGILRGEWVDLPIDNDKYAAVCKRIGIDAMHEEMFISDYDCDDSRLCGLLSHLDEYDNISLLNWLAGELSALASWQIDAYAGALALGDHTGSIYDMIALTQDLDNYMLLGDVNDDDDLGRYYVDLCSLDVSTMGPLADYIDYEAYGRDVRMEEGGVYTDGGYVVCVDDTTTALTWDDMPDEYRLCYDVTALCAVV